MPIDQYNCPRGHSYDHLYKGERPDAIPCPTCGDEAKYVIALSRHSGVRFAQYNFYDPSAGRRFEDESAMKRWCAANGVTEDTGGGTEWLENRQRAVRAQIAEDEAIVADHEDRMANDPAFAPVRKLKDSGFFADKVKEELAAQGLANTPVHVNVI